ncbi:hypothetical protein GCM10027047_20130 [Rhodococcus aerolatus]
MSFLLRVQVPDQPGSLGALATALGAAGADILSVDVVERGGDHATDDLVVDLPRGAPADTLITAAEVLPGVRVVSVRPYTGVLDTHGELALVDHVAATIGDRLQVLVDGIPRVLRVGWATVVDAGPRGAYRVVGSPAAPETRAVGVPWLPLTGPLALDPQAEWVPAAWRERDTALAAAPLGERGSALLLGRPGGPEFRPSEVARLGHLAGIVATVLR